MSQIILEKKLKEIKIRVDNLTDNDVKKYVESYPLLKKYYSKLNTIRGNCKKCGFCCIGGTMISEGEINAIHSFISEIDDFIRTLVSKNLVTGEISRYTATKCSKYGYCIFNADEGTCIIHKIRPISCRLVPFHPKRKGTCAKNVNF
ncbi:MAG: YkgJ family cysteine cluster protein, partial [Promethearchaeota archaeon]